jgi:hypothetical protein
MENDNMMLINHQGGSQSRLIGDDFWDGKMCLPVRVGKSDLLRQCAPIINC